MASHALPRPGYTRGGPVPATSELVRKLTAKLSITEALHRYCRGLDRMDRTVADTVWHADGTADYGPDYRGSASGFLDFVWAYHAQLDRHSHQVSNVLIDVDDAAGTAVSESYVSVWLRTHPVDGRVSDLFHRGRYIDTWSCRDDVWGIDHRTFVADLYREVTHAASTLGTPSGRRDVNDPSYMAFKA
ncbi:nuclear transport factor 2 family protein [Streptomyces sp. NPDC050264]|uniref:nuclear transport factor 2 family protein n=1 Tax=Streptomyces sp. NPDC050264 TaxID=3155038 RepID=UPI0034454E1F